MNSIYHIAILEGYLSQHAELPRNVQDAITYFKQLASPPLALKSKKKRKLSQEHLQKLRQGAINARAVKNGMEAPAVWTAEKLNDLRIMKADGLSYSEIGEKLGVTTKAVGNAAYKNGI